MRVARWGNSLAVRLPASVVQALDLQEGDDVVIELAERGRLGVAAKPTNAELLESLRKYRGLIPADFKFDREEAYERG